MSRDKRPLLDHFRFRHAPKTEVEVVQKGQFISTNMVTVRPLLIIGVERDYLRGTICLVPSLTAVLYTSAVHMCTCVCVLSLCGREVV